MRAAGETLLVLILATLTVSHGNPDAKRLYDDLLSNYNKLVRPVVNVSDALAVQIKLKLSQLIDVNLKNQIMTTNLWVEQTWYDYKLTWEPKDYGGVEMLHVPSDQIWRPDIVLYNNADGNFEVTLATKTTLDYTGRIEWRPPAIYKSSCEIDVEYFPFDEQTCVMKFGSWTYDGFQVDLRHIDESNGTNVVKIGIDLGEFYPSVEWDVLEVPAIRNEKFYTCCDEPYLDITFNITMRRKTLFYTVNLIIPCMGISFLTILVFYLPSDSGEKVSLSISILLSLTVFFLLLAEIIPPTSLVVPLLGKFVLFTMILDTFSICVTVIVLNVHFRSPQTHTMAPWVRTVFIHHLPKLLFMRRPIYPYDRLRGPGAHRFIVRTCNGLELRAGTCDSIDGGLRSTTSCCEHIDTSIPPLPPSVVMQAAGLMEHHHHHHLLDMDATDSMCLNQCRMHGGNCPSSSDDVVNPHPPACLNVSHHHHHLHHYQHTNNTNTTRNTATSTAAQPPINASSSNHHQHHGQQGVFSPTSSTSSSPLAPPRRLANKSRQFHRQLKTCCLSPGSLDNISCGGHLHNDHDDLRGISDHHVHHHHHPEYANHELIPVFQSAGDLSIPAQPPPLIVDPIITSIAAVAAAAATAALTSLKSEETETGLTNKTLTTTTTITTPKRLTGGGGGASTLTGSGGDMRGLKLEMGNKTKNVIKKMAYGGNPKSNINSVSISDNSISISQSLADDSDIDGGGGLVVNSTTGVGVTTATKASQTPKSTKKKTATATATITKQIPSHCSGGEGGGLITTSATITGEAECSQASSDVDGGTVSSYGSTLLYGTNRSRSSHGEKASNQRGVEDGNGDVGHEDDEVDEEGSDGDEDEEVDHELVNGSGENLVETGRNNRKGKQCQPKKLKATSKTKSNPRSKNNDKCTTNNHNNHSNNNNSNKKNQNQNVKQLKTNFDDIAAAAAGGASAELSGSSTKVSGLRNRWHGCPELHKAMAGVTYIADHTRKEEESTRVKEDWKFVAMVLDRLFLWLFTIAVVVGTAGIILHAPTLYDTRVPIDIKISEIASTTAKPHITRPIL